MSASGETWVVPASLDGQRLDRVVALLGDVPRTAARAAIADGRVRVNDAVALKGSETVATGDEVRAEVTVAPQGVTAEPDVPITVAWEDPAFVVLDKAPGVVVHPGAGTRRGTLIAGVLARYPEIAALAEGPDDDRPGVVHRLDKGTSGLVVVARTEPALVALRAAIAGHQVTREYVALVAGAVGAARGAIDAPLGRSLRDPLRVAVRSDGRPAVTHYEVIERRESWTLLRLTLETGRTHQIRAHLAAIGHPVVNDPRYGTATRSSGLAADRPFLHAARLAFAHPITEVPIEVNSPLPADLAAALERLA